MKRLLCLISNMNAGGAETFLMKLYREIDKTKYQMDFCINIREKNYYEDEINSLGGKIYRIPARTKNLKSHNIKLKKIIEENKYQYILAVSSSTTSFMDLKIAKQAGAKICSIRSSNSNLNMPFKKKIIQNILRVFYNKYADNLISPSDLAAICMFGDDFKKDNRFHYLNNSVNFDEYAFTIEKRKKIRKEFLFSDDELVIGHIGRFYKQKNHLYLINIFNEIVKRRPKSKLLLVGSGELENGVRKYVNDLGINEQVIFAGTRSDVNNILSGMDIFVFPSLYEGMPNTVIEAEASGLPCILSDTITKQVNLTNNVYFKSLNDSPENWANIILNVSENNFTRDTKDVFKKNKYDIQSCLKQFTELVFGDKND